MTVKFQSSHRIFMRMPERIFVLKGKLKLETIILENVVVILTNSTFNHNVFLKLPTYTNTIMLAFNKGD